MTGKLIAAYVFGSVGRGQADPLSDLDILAVVENNRGKISEQKILDLIPPRLRLLKPSISWYGALRVAEMFRNGELFAWHLHRETFPIYDPVDFLAKLGRPAEYRECLADVASFRSILYAIPEQIVRMPFNAAYEAGLVYICLRNIAMSASWLLCEQPDFSRYSVFNLRGVPRCSISVEEFETAMHCRMASQRGFPPPDAATPHFIADLFNRINPWLNELDHSLEELAHGRRYATDSV